jgi:hypothetical protein
MFLFTCSLSLIVFITVAYYLKDSSFDGVGSDSKKHIYAASQFKNWGLWPSGMHKYAHGKAWMKDVGVIFYVLFKKLFRKDETSFYPIMIVSNLAHCLSGVLLFILTNKFLSEELSFIIFLLYIFSPWAFMIIAHGGLQLLAQCLFLISLNLLPFDPEEIYINVNLLYLISGLFFALTNFSSASARKLNIVYLCASLFSISMLNTLDFSIDALRLDSLELIILAFFLVVMLILFVTYLKREKITRLIYEDKLWLRFKAKDVTDFDYYLNKVHHLTKYFMTLSLSFVSILLLIMLFTEGQASYVNILYIIMGCSFGSFIFLMPNLLENLLGFYKYSIAESDWGSHYRIYDDYFLKNYGIVFEKGNEGLGWYIIFYFRMIPLESFLFIVSSVWLIFAQPVSLIIIIITILISLSPIIWGEITIGPKAALPLYTTYMALFMPFLLLLQRYSDPSLDFFGSTLILLTLLVVIRNIYIIASDIIPSRSSVAQLNKLLESKGVYNFTTLDTEYNYPFIEVLQDQFPGKYSVTFTDSTNGLENGFLFIPCLSSLAPYYQSNKVSIESDIERLQFDELILKSIKDSKAEKIKTLGGSKYWRTIGNVCAFRDLILQEREIEIRTHAWLIKI